MKKRWFAAMLLILTALPLLNAEAYSCDLKARENKNSDAEKETGIFSSGTNIF